MFGQQQPQQDPFGLFGPHTDWGDSKVLQNKNACIALSAVVGAATAGMNAYFLRSPVLPAVLSTACASGFASASQTEPKVVVQHDAKLKEFFSSYTAPLSEAWKEKEKKKKEKKEKDSAFYELLQKQKTLGGLGEGIVWVAIFEEFEESEFEVKKEISEWWSQNKDEITFWVKTDTLSTPKVAFMLKETDFNLKTKLQNPIFQSYIASTEILGQEDLDKLTKFANNFVLASLLCQLAKERTKSTEEQIPKWVSRKILTVLLKLSQEAMLFLTSFFALDPEY